MAPDDVPASLTQFRDALRAGRPPSLPFAPSSDLSRVASLLTAFDGAALDSLVRDAPLARVGALCEALSTTRAFHNKSFGAAQIELAARALPQASPDLIERLDKALFAHPATVDALRTFFSCGGDGPHARRAAEALSEKDAATLSAVPSELRAVLVKRCPQMADGVIEDEDALRNVLRAWTEGGFEWMHCDERDALRVTSHGFCYRDGRL